MRNICTEAGFIYHVILWGKIITKQAENVFHVVNFPFIRLMLVALSGKKWKEFVFMICWKRRWRQSWSACQTPHVQKVVMPGAGCTFFMGCLVELEETVEKSSFVDAEKSYITCSPGSLQLAVTRVGQSPTCIPHGNKALNLFSWKQLVVSQIQMPTPVLTANLLDECWIYYYYYCF